MSDHKTGQKKKKKLKLHKSSSLKKEEKLCQHRLWGKIKLKPSRAAVFFSGSFWHRLWQVFPRLLSLRVWKDWSLRGWFSCRLHAGTWPNVSCGDFSRKQQKLVSGALLSGKQPRGPKKKEQLQIFNQWLLVHIKSILSALHRCVSVKFTTPAPANIWKKKKEKNCQPTLLWIADWCTV